MEISTALLNPRGNTGSNALRRGYLRMKNSDAVATIINSRFSDASIPKTSAQCRHKMEKLRQRYRAKKQRSLSYPYPASRFIFSWFFFDYMDAMENKTNLPSVETVSGDNFNITALLKSFLDQSILKLKLKSKNSVNSSPILVAKNFEHTSYLDTEDNKAEHDHTSFGAKFCSEKIMGGFSMPPVKFKAKNSNISDGNEDVIPPGLRTKKLDGRMNFDFNNGDEEYYGLRGSVKAMKRGRYPVEEMVESMKSLAERLVTMEKAKVEMAREMEMELNRNEMILDS
ncbi:Hypothetical predicted protein [Olea europaea subsp. europaea]|uniref:Myb/SANT-like DNA-binding domain-containing protein n=1 Tax=Olea europaea subsp. europaea TaxID=158383 RepID=A0A8S0SFN9_OLEEU|nr:Hypothetical predicted protein [Olea europaea subsp. europaea]